MAKQKEQSNQNKNDMQNITEYVQKLRAGTGQQPIQNGGSVSKQNVKKSEGSTDNTTAKKTQSDDGPSGS